MITVHEPAIVDPNEAYLAIVARVSERPDWPHATVPYHPVDAARWAESVPGWMSINELEWLASRAAELKAGERWVEIGTWKGRSFSSVALAVPDGCTVLAVDHWNGSIGEQNTFHADAEVACVEFFKTYFAIKEMRSKTDLYFNAIGSLAAARIFPDRSLATVFLDGSHDYESVKADILAWLPKLRKGGLLCGHDATMPGVQRALYDTIGKGKWKHELHTIWSYRKP